MPNPVAVVTGGTGGIGRGIAAALQSRNFDVVTLDLHPGGCVHGDIADLNDHPRMVDALFERFGRVDCLVNAAGVSVHSRGDLLDITSESYDHNFAVNTRGTFFLTQAICKRMLSLQHRSTESSRSLIFISSSNAVIASPERGEYAMSKSAVAMMARLFALRLAAHGIAVYEVRPGLIETPMTEAAKPRYDKLLQEGFTPFNRWGTPHDVGQAVATLASGDLPFATGAVIEIDGGLHIHQY